MGCNCGKTAKFKWIYTPPSGPQVTYTSEVQAQAAKIRWGGSYVRVAA